MTQIPNKSQITNPQNFVYFGNFNLFGAWDFGFGDRRVVDGKMMRRVDAELFHRQIPDVAVRRPNRKI